MYWVLSFTTLLLYVLWFLLVLGRELQLSTCLECLELSILAWTILYQRITHCCCGCPHSASLNFIVIVLWTPQIHMETPKMAVNVQSCNLSCNRLKIKILIKNDSDSCSWVPGMKQCALLLKPAHLAPTIMPPKSFSPHTYV